MGISVRLAAQTLFQKTTRNLLNNTHNIDSTSLASTLHLLSKKNVGLPIQTFVPDTSKCRQIEDQILVQWEAFINQDISVVTSSLMRLDYTPKRILENINKMT